MPVPSFASWAALNEYLAAACFADLDRHLLADGEGVSSGERARLALTRGLLAGCRLIVIDDVAGHLDEATRVRVAEYLTRRPDVAIIEASSGPTLLPGAELVVVGA